MSPQRYVVSLRAASMADVLHVDTPEAITLLSQAARGSACEADWDRPRGHVEGTEGSDFLKVSGFPNMLAFREALTARSDLELYLEYGEFLQVDTQLGRFTLWHHLADASLNVLDKASVDPDGIVRHPKFLAARLPLFCSVYTTPECRNTHLFLTAAPSELPSKLGGAVLNDMPAPGGDLDNCRSLLLEYTWRGWTGLEFEIVWRSKPDEI